MQPENQGEYWHSQTNEPASTVPPVMPPSSPYPAAPAPQPYQQPTPQPNDNSVSWQASEYIHHEKRGTWFIVLFSIAFVLLLLAIFLIKSYTFAALIIAMTIAVAVYAVRPPRLMQYQLSSVGIRINDKAFRLDEFRYFGVLQDGPLYSAILIPVKRFLPAVTLYFPEENGEIIVDMLGSRLPMEKVELDVIDRAMRHLRF